MQRRTLVASALTLPLIARAHHGWSCFDLSRPLWLEGRASQVSWRNPHVELRLDLAADLRLPADLAARKLPAQTAAVDGSALLKAAQLPTRKDRQWQVELAPLTRMQAWKVPEIRNGAELGLIGFTFAGEKGDAVLRAEYLFLGGQVYGLKIEPGLSGSGAVSGPAMHNDETLTSAAGSPLLQVFERQGVTALRWRSSRAPERALRIVRLRDALLEQLDEVYQAARDDLGKSAGEVDLTEILPICVEANEAVRQIERWMKPRPVRATWLTLGTRSQVRYQPRGRCLIIGPYNYPLNLTLSPLISALAAGNPVVLKPSELTPALSAVLARLIEKIFSEDEVAVFQGPASVAQALQALPFDHVFFTGSPQVGRQVMAAASRHLASVTLELGGKSPTVVDASADLPLAARNILWAKFTNAGQTCIAPDHVYVHESVMDEWVACCRRELDRVFGAAFDPGAGRLTAMVNDRHADRIRALLDDARARGARLIWGGQSQSRHVQPTLLGQVPDDALMMQQEIFGPLLPVIAYRDLDAVIERINAGPKPLALYLYSRSLALQERVLSQTSSGGVCMNHALVHYLHSGLPFGGVSQSGLGQARGFHGFRSFSHERAVLAARWPAVVHFFSAGPVPSAQRRLARWAFTRL